MAGRRSFKSDVSFLEKISMGAIGTQRVFEHLKSQGHNPLELERGSKSFKIWKEIKIKRIRVPDILCVSCGHRVESRAKKVLEISMSHSHADPERGWSYGMEDTDYVALVVCKKLGERPIDWLADDLVQYISVHELKVGQDQRRVVYIRPKGAEEGFEVRISWPASIAKASGTIQSINSNLIQYRQPGSRSRNYGRLSKSKFTLTPLVQIGESVVENQVLAAVVPVVKQFPCTALSNEDYYIGRLASPSLSQRYAAAKALSVFSSEKVSEALTNKLQDAEDHIYVKLEAAASLARQDREQGWLFIEQGLADAYLQNRLEAVIIPWRDSGKKIMRDPFSCLINSGPASGDSGRCCLGAWRTA